MPCVGCEKECKCTNEKCGENCKCSKDNKCNCHGGATAGQPGKADEPKTCCSKKP